jgi:uncharacterized membrane protein YwzB
MLLDFDSPTLLSPFRDDSVKKKKTRQALLVVVVVVVVAAAVVSHPLRKYKAEAVKLRFSAVSRTHRSQ